MNSYLLTISLTIAASRQSCPAVSTVSGLLLSLDIDMAGYQGHAGGYLEEQTLLNEAIANFRPTPKEVINGIAPHVFDERRRRRRRSATWSPEISNKKGGGGESSPLRTVALKDDTDGGSEELKTEDNDSQKSETVTRGKSFRWPLILSSFRIDIPVLKTIGTKLRSTKPRIGN
ncbi:hypothetical protein C8J56DRAFT_917749 [Mycena floridula]|nr:hypothetical protein C8J56DRAFT_917749 [Mycena floridula]